MSHNALHQDGMNAIIVGNGGIGSALAESLLQRENLQQLVILQRNSEARFNDPRVEIVDFDAERPESLVIASTIIRKKMKRAHLAINTVGLLHSEQQQPEKRLSSLDPVNLQRSFTINAVLLPVLAHELSDLLRHGEGSIFASLSARVGSIEDNRLGGWYSYRASKAAHNMLLRTIAHKWRISHPDTVIVALHPGTVCSRLSKPFISPGYNKNVHTPAEAADYLLSVISGLTAESSGQFFDWQGEAIAW